MHRQGELVSMTVRETTRITGQERQLKFDFFPGLSKRFGQISLTMGHFLVHTWNDSFGPLLQVPQLYRGP